MTYARTVPLLLLLLLVGCVAQRPVPTPRSPAEALAQAHVTLDQATESTARLLSLKAITVAQAKSIERRLSQAEEGLETAARLLKAGTEGTPAQLQAAQEIIRQVMDELAAAERGKP